MTPLQQLFKNHKTILIIGIGNYFRSDDGAGPRIVERLTENSQIRLLNAETNIERYIEPIQQSQAEALLFIDCVHFGMPPGYFGLMPIEQVNDHTLHSHNISLARLRQFFNKPAFLLGIQPASLAVSERLSPEVERAVEKVSAELLELISSLGE